MNRMLIQTLVAAVIISNSALLPLPRAMAQTEVKNPAAPVVAKEKEICTKHLKMIYEAIQAYRKDHKDIPNWLSDLVPKYIADSALLVCPAMTRTGAQSPFPWLADPKTATCYLYEFCDGEMRSIWNGGKMKMRDWKMMQMAMIGGDVPIVRCSLHGQALSLTFSGKIFEGPLSWEYQFSDVINSDDLSPGKLTARFAEILGRQTQALERGPAPRTSPAAANGNVLAGKPAPNFKLELLDGGPFELAAFKNKNIVLLDFWATWCGPLPRGYDRAPTTGYRI